MAHPASHFAHPGTKNFFIGMIFMFLASIFFALIVAFAKVAFETLPISLVAFYQFLISTLLITPFVLNKGSALLRTQHPILHLVRDISGFLIYYPLYFSVTSISLVDAMVLVNTAPLFIPLIILVWFRVHLNKLLWFSIIIGFIGVVFILNPRGKEFLQLETIPALIAGIMAGIVQVAGRRLALTEKPSIILFYFFLLSTLISTVIVSIAGAWQWPTLREWPPLLGMGISLPLMQYFRTRAYRYAPASLLAPFLYFTTIFSGVIGWLYWAEVPGWNSYVGTALIICGAILSIAIGHLPSVPTDDKSRQ